VSLDLPKSTFLDNYISALIEGWPLKFLHALEFDRTLVTHIAIRVGGPLKNFKGEHLNLGLEFYLCASITLAVVGVTSRNFTSGCDP